MSITKGFMRQLCKVRNWELIKRAVVIVFYVQCKIPLLRQHLCKKKQPWFTSQVLGAEFWAAGCWGKQCCVGHRTVCTGGAGITTLKKVLKDNRKWFYFWRERKGRDEGGQTCQYSGAGWGSKELQMRLGGGEALLQDFLKTVSISSIQACRN